MKIGIIGIIGILAIALGLGCGGDREENAGERTVNATGRASDQVDAMMETFAKMSPVEPDADSASARKSDEGAKNGDADGADNSIKREFEVRKAFALMRKYSEGGNLDNDAYVMAARQLKESWTPLFEQAHRDYKELNIRIALAKDTADEYFNQQASLTAEINDPEFRAELVGIDFKQRQAFMGWSTTADGVAEAAYNMMLDMEDMDVFIAKANLSAYFIALQKSSAALPESMISLNVQLTEFEKATKALTEAMRQESSDGA